MGHANLKFWTALEYADIDDKSDKSKRTLVVTGQAEVNEAPTLEEQAAPQDADLKFSTLEYKGNSWKTVWFQKKIISGAYDKVQLLIPSGAHATGGHLMVKPAPREFRCSDANCGAPEEKPT
jgi:hypothetical protein